MMTSFLVALYKSHTRVIDPVCEAGVSDFSLRVALQTLLREYTETTKSHKDAKTVVQPTKTRPRRKARKYLYAIGTLPASVCVCETLSHSSFISLTLVPFLTQSGGYTRLQGGRWSDSRALSCVERFDSFSQFWTTVSSVHQARSGLGVSVLDGMIYVVGGVYTSSL